ncbi:hypothetical protein EV191_12727 [Tamaricihabitans halophyticus]|uniref:Uncharacterized protein n=1 Tax=Tamaricihabitans halophyticus TaxID=1262583 RepID=A0A4R2PYM0_9PSEU|nr:hypothetical protein [Tamaricihabitans halophyticus]TCP41129.1 hypothetical protein EV191_12727 [Tamaricihabitans halophyticus]
MDRRRDGLPQLSELGELFDKHVGRHLESPMVGQLREKFDRWNDPAARLVRRRRRASRLLTFWIILLLVFGTVAGLGFAGVVGGGGEIVTLGSSGSLLLAIVAGALSVRTGIRLRALNRTELPESSTPPPLPPRESAARAPMEQLAEAQQSLDQLMGTLHAGGGSSLIPEASVADARETAAEAAAALHQLADRIQAIERARESAPQRERVALGEAVHTLLGQLERGLEGYRSLVAAAGRAVAESSGHLDEHQRRLTEATDHLAGLAIAVREVSARGQ